MNTSLDRSLGPRSLAARAEAVLRRRAQLVEAIDNGTVRRVLLLVPDPHARFAAVELAAEFVRDVVLHHGYGACTYLFAWDVERTPIDVIDLARFLGGYGDLLLRPDLASLLELSKGTWAVICDAEWPDGSAVDVAPRQVLRDQLITAESMGLLVSVGLEHEVTFCTGDGKPLTEHGIDYALGGAAPLVPLVASIRSAADGCGLRVESARAECHPGQYEIVLRHRDPLAACDDALLLQHLVRTTASDQGVCASYLAAQEPGQGSSCHVHLSLSTMDGRPIDANPDGGMSRLFGHFLAGVLSNAADLSAIWAPTLNSYVRLRTAPFAPREVRWGHDDRTAAIRLAGRDHTLRLECRFAGADAQPHLVVAALLAAGLAGIRQELDSPPAGTVVGHLADSPWAAMRLLTSGAPSRLLGESVVAHQTALLGAELDTICQTVSDIQRTRGALRA